MPPSPFKNKQKVKKMKKKRTPHPQPTSPLQDFLEKRVKKTRALFPLQKVKKSKRKRINKTPAPLPSTFE